MATNDIGNEDLARVETIIDKKRYFPESKIVQALSADLSRLKDRVNDQYLHLAIVGEFSAGKSTLINALVGEKLLKSASVATTAAETHIRSGQKMEVNVELLGGARYVATEDDPRPLAKAIQDCGGAPPKPTARKGMLSIFSRDSLQDRRNDIKRSLSALTADSNLASKVARCVITLPCQLPVPRLDIIDTPGIGAGASEAAFHFSVTQRILEMEADAILVLIPSSQPVSASLLKFIRDNLSRVLDRCLFLLTRSDEHDEDEMEEILNYTMKQLRDNLRRAPKRVIPISAVAAMPNVPDNFFKENPRSFHQEEFCHAIQYIHSELQENRADYIREKSVMLFQHLLARIQPYVDKCNDDLATQLKVLKTRSSQSVGQSMAEVWSRAEYMLEQERDCQSESVRILFREANSPNAQILWEKKVFPMLQNGSVPSASRLLKLVKKQCDSTLNSLASHILSQLENRPTIKEAEDYINKAFLACYDIIPKKPQKLKIPRPERAKFTPPTVEASEYKKLSEEFDKGDNVGCILMLAAVVVLGGIGAAVGAGAGAVVGALIGFFLAAMSYHKDCRKRAERMSNKVHKAMDEFLNQYCESYIKQMNCVTDAWCAELKSRLHGMLTQICAKYTGDVESVLQTYKSKANACERELAEASEDCAWLKSKIKSTQKGTI